MGVRGRKSSNANAVQTLVAPTEVVQRPDAPYDLTDDQADEWWAVVNRMPADWFTRETHPLLAQYCRHVVAARRVAQLIAQTEKQKTIDVEQYDQLLKMQEREGRAISSLATRMRISQQATLTKRADKGSGGMKKPWE